MSNSLSIAGASPRSCKMRRRISVFCALLVLGSTLPALAQPCQPQGLPILELRVTPGEMGSAGKELRISVHDNDCVSLHLPDYYRRRGDYLLALNGGERAELEVLQRGLREQPYDQQRMLAEASSIEARRADSSGAERFAVLDADHYVLTLRDDTQFVTTTRALAVFQYAERYPEIRSLEALQQLASGLIALSERSDLVAATKTAPITEAGQ
jgi:hypothetical protein